jgi:hypothetical protein
MRSGRPVARIEPAEVAGILEGLCAAAQDTARAALERDERRAGT